MSGCVRMSDDENGNSNYNRDNKKRVSRARVVSLPHECTQLLLELEGGLNIVLNTENSMYVCGLRINDFIKHNFNLRI